MSHGMEAERKYSGTERPTIGQSESYYTPLYCGAVCCTVLLDSLSTVCSP